MGPGRRRAIQLTVTLGVLAALLAGAELGARALYVESPPAWKVHPFLGFVPTPGFHEERLAVDTREPFLYEVNALGLRSRTLATREKPAGSYRVLVLGGSTIEQGDLPLERTIAGRLEEKLVARFPGRRIEVGNAGISGASSDQVLAQIVHRILALDPDLVCIYEPALNDFHASLRDDWDPTTYDLAASPRPPRFTEWLASQSRFVAVLRAKLGGSGAPDARKIFAERVALRRENPINEPTAFDILREVPRFRKNTRRAVRLLLDEGVLPLLMTEPTLLKPNLTPEEDAHVASLAVMKTDWNLRPETELEALEAYNEAVREVAREEGALLVDLERDVPRTLENFVDDVHLSATGSAVAAEALAAEIARTGTPPTRGKR